MSESVKLKKEIDQLLSEAEERRLSQRGYSIGEVLVDSGAVEFSFGGNLKGATKFRREIAELTCETARMGYCQNRKFGFIRTPDGDGLFKINVIEEPVARGRLGRDFHFIGQISIPRNPTELVLGDCEKIQCRFDVSGLDFSAIFAWRDETLWIGLPLWMRKTS